MTLFNSHVYIHPFNDILNFSILKILNFSAKFFMKFYIVNYVAHDDQNCCVIWKFHDGHSFIWLTTLSVNFNLLMKSKSKCGRNTHLYTQTYRKIRLLEVPLSNISEFSTNNGCDSYRKIRKESKIGVKMAQICL